MWDTGGRLLLVFWYVQFFSDEALIVGVARSETNLAASAKVARVQTG